MLRNIARTISSSRNMSVKLQSGATIPRIGFGVGTAWFGRKGVDPELKGAVLTALKAGYTHLDLAEGYANEESIGAALKEYSGKREDLWITEKILGGMADIKGTLKKQLKDLGIDYVDLYLLHAPQKLFPEGSPDQQGAWKQLEELVDEGLVKNIGISNHRVSDVKKILETAKITPAVNQIELHPYIYSEAKEIVDFCHSKGIKIQAYSPSAPVVYFPGGSVDATLSKIARSLGEKSGQTVTEGQVLLKWAAQVGDIVITTSSKEYRMKEQLAVNSLPDLTSDEISAIEQDGRKGGPKRKYMEKVFQD